MRTETFETPHPIDLVISIPAGTVEVEAADVTATTVELEVRKDRSSDALDDATIELRGNTLRIEVSEKKFWGLQVGFGAEFTLRVRCPRTSSLEVKTASCDVAAHGPLGSAKVTTASGDVELERVEGDANVKTASGDVELPYLGGRARVNTVSGDVTIEHAADDATVRTVSGDVSIVRAAGPVSVTSISGDQTLESVVEGEVALQSVSGDMNVRIAQGSRLWVDANSVSGDMDSEFSLGDAPPAEDGPLVELRAKSVSGDIVVGRARVRV